jgi:hypothetical protein
VNLAVSFAKAYQIRQVTGKTSWTYLIKKSRYQVEVSIHKVWDGTSTTSAPKIGCGVTLFGRSWDDQMGSMNIAKGTRDWGNGFPEMLRPNEDGLDQLLRRTREIQVILSDVSREASLLRSGWE